MNEAKLSAVVDFLTGKLRCSQRSLSNLLNMDKNTLSNNTDKTLEELTPTTRKKIFYLYYIVAKYLPAHDPDAVHQMIKTHVYKNFTGEKDSVLSSIQQLKHDLETLEFIVQSAKNEYEEQIRQLSPVDLEDATKARLCA